MTREELAKKRAELEHLIEIGYNDYDTSLDLLDIIESQMADVERLDFIANMPASTYIELGHRSENDWFFSESPHRAQTSGDGATLREALDDAMRNK